MSGDEVAQTGKGPARGYSWAPFEKGHELSMRHGAYSDRRVEPLVQEFVALVHAWATAEGSPVPWLTDPTYSPEILALARAEAEIQLITEWLADRESLGLDGDGGELGVSKKLHRAEARASRLRASLGLSPLSRARMGRDVAGAQVDVARLMAEAAEREAGDGGSAT